MLEEKIRNFVCGSDTIFCPDEFGIDDGYYANYSCMRAYSIAYAASFGDPHFTEESYKVLGKMLQNFKAFGLIIRKEKYIQYKKVTKWKQRLVTRENYYFGPKGIKEWYRKFRKTIFNLLPKRIFIDVIEKECYRYSETDTLINLMGTVGGRKQHILKNGLITILNWNLKEEN